MEGIWEEVREGSAGPTLLRLCWKWIPIYRVQMGHSPFSRLQPANKLSSSWEGEPPDPHVFYWVLCFCVWECSLPSLTHANPSAKSHKQSRGYNFEWETCHQGKRRSGKIQHTFFSRKGVLVCFHGLKTDFAGLSKKANFWPFST